MKNIFSIKTNARVRPNDISVKAHKSPNFGDKSLTNLGPETWNVLAQDMKAETSYLIFKEYIATLFGPRCICNLYKCSS